MRWTRGYQSDQVDDRRAEGSAGGGGGLGGGGLNILMWLFSRFGLPGVLVGGALLYFMGDLGLGGQSTSSMSERSAESAEESASAAKDDPEKDAVSFVSFVLDDVQKHWAEYFASQGKKYPLARMVLFRGATESACGMGQRAMGPFYCPRDRNVYIDLSFYRELKDRFGAPGDFAQAYVIAHEVGHHVQHLLGLDRGGGSVALELQADCLAGVWGNSTERRSLLDAGDIDEALTAAAAIGDDKLQKEAGQAVRPETFTHGSSQERVQAFKKGFRSGQFSSCE